MATVVHKQYQPGEKVFGGAGATVFRPYPKTQSFSTQVELEPEVLLANAAEASLLRLLAQNPTDDIESQDLGKQT
jgi:hypothetical protein